MRTKESQVLHRSNIAGYFMTFLWLRTLVCECVCISHCRDCY